MCMSFYALGKGVIPYLALGTVLPANFQRKLLKEGRFVAKMTL